MLVLLQKAAERAHETICKNKSLRQNLLLTISFEITSKSNYDREKIETLDIFSLFSQLPQGKFLFIWDVLAS